MFKNPDIQRAASQNGFAVIDSNLHKEVEQLYAYISNHFKFTHTDFFYSLMANTYETNKVIQKALLEILHNFFETHFTGYKILNTSFLAKPADTKEEFLLHQDWCYTDERSYNAYNIWIPLTDVNAENGAMFFLPCSHLWFENYRSGSLHSSRITSADDTLKPYLQTVPLKKGQVILFNPAVFHGSHPNLSNQNRLVVTSTILPQEAPFLYFQKGEVENEVGVFNMEGDAFLIDLEKLAFGGKPTSPEMKRLKYTHCSITKSELTAKVMTNNKPLYCL
jgi:hypothetical protein